VPFCAVCNVDFDKLIPSVCSGCRPSHAMDVCKTHSVSERCAKAPEPVRSDFGPRKKKRPRKEVSDKEPSDGKKEKDSKEDKREKVEKEPSLIERLKAAALAKSKDRPIGHKEVVLGATWYGETFHAAAAAALQLYAGASLRVYIRVREGNEGDLRRARRQAFFIQISGCEDVRIITAAEWRKLDVAYTEKPWFDVERGEKANYNLSAGMGVATYIIEQATWNLRQHGVDVHDFLRQVWLGSMKGESQAAVEKFVTEALANHNVAKSKKAMDLEVGLGSSSLDAQAYPRCLIVSRHNDTKPFQNTNNLALKQMNDALWEAGIVPVHIGSRIPNFAYRDPSDAENQTNVFVEHFRSEIFAAEDSYQRDLYLYYLLWTRYEVIGQIGPKSGANDGPAMMGLPTLYFEHFRDPRHDRLAKLVGAFKPLYRFLWTQDFLAHAAGADDDSDQRGSFTPKELGQLLVNVLEWRKLGQPGLVAVPPMPIDPNYRIVPVPGDGDCFFHVVGRSTAEQTALVRRRMAHRMALELFNAPYDDIRELTGQVLSGVAFAPGAKVTAVATEIRRRYALTRQHHGNRYPASIAEYVVQLQFTRAEVAAMALWQVPPPNRPAGVTWGDEDTALYVASLVYGVPARLYAHLAGDGLAIIAEYPGQDDQDGIDIYYNHLHFDAIDFNIDRAVYRH
jgi:hypothetical protein